MNIAIIQLANYHTEVMGTILQVLNDIYNNSHFHLFVPSNTTSYLSYYIHNIPNIQYTVHPNNMTAVCNQSHIDLYVWLTSRECVGKLRSNDERNKTIAIAHVPKEVLPSVTNLVLSHLSYRKVPKISTILPIFVPPKTIINNITERPIIITLIGASDYSYKAKDFDTLRRIHDNLPHNIRIQIITRSGHNIINLMKLCPKYIVKLNCDTKLFMESVLNSHFLLTLFKPNSWYHQDRMSGSFPLSFSYGLPLITDRATKDSYGLSDDHIIYDNDITLLDAINTISHMTNDEYQVCHQNILKDRQMIYEYNVKAIQRWI